MKSLVLGVLLSISFSSFANSMQVNFPNSMARQMENQIFETESSTLAAMSRTLEISTQKPIRGIPQIRLDEQAVRSFGSTTDEIRTRTLQLRPKPGKEPRLAIIVVASGQQLSLLSSEQKKSVLDVVNSLKNYDSTLENLSLSLIYQTEETLRAHAMAQASLEFFESEETKERYAQKFSQILTGNLSQEPSLREQQIDEMKYLLRQGYPAGKFPTDFVESLE